MDITLNKTAVKITRKYIDEIVLKNQSLDIANQVLSSQNADCIRAIQNNQETISKLEAELENLRTLASSRAGDMATLLAENAALQAWRNHVENFYPHLDFDEWYAGEQVRAAHLTGADGDGQGDEGARR